MDIASESSDYELENNQATLSEAEINTFLELGESEKFLMIFKKMGVLEDIRTSVISKRIEEESGMCAGLCESFRRQSGCDKL